MVRRCRWYCNKDVPTLQKAVGAVLYHYSESRDPQARHLFCPTGSLTWCKFQADIANGTKDYVDKPGLPSHLRDALKPIFTRLSSPELLSKCLHGTTQNNNEALNGVIWQKCPKEVFVERQTLEVGVCSAIVNFNSGMNGVIAVLRDLGMSPGHFTMAFCKKKNAIRMENMDLKTSSRGKARRKKLHNVRKGFIDAHVEKEGVTYEAGGF
jgi:hypothetical protein